VTNLAEPLTLRRARPEDITALEAHIAASARALGEGHYSAAETEAAIAHVFGVDSELVADGTYFIVESADRRIAGCGGWSFRPTLFGGDRYAARSTGRLDPAHDAARIRAFFVSGSFARMGVGRQLLEACEDAARAAGFTRMALMATLPGVPFYAACGFIADAPQTFDLGGTAVRFVPMTKQI
jgi:GNAT superfamily N-acetyltransferase